MDHLKFFLALDHKQAKAHVTDVCALLNGKMPTTVDGDTLKLSYEVYLHYFGDVECRLGLLPDC
jgi:hypothetical protein